MTRTINVDLLQSTLEYVTEHVQQWDQRGWILRSWCGTTGCFAGTAVLNAGYRPWFGGPDENHAAFVQVDANHRFAWLVGDVHIAAVEDVAIELLGLTQEQANRLFYWENTLADLWEHAAVLTDGAVWPRTVTVTTAEEDTRELLAVP